MDKIKEVMGLVDEYAKYERQCTRFAIEAKLRELLARDPIAHLWKHGETGLARVVMPDMVFTADANWLYVGPLVLGISNDSKGM